MSNLISKAIDKLDEWFGTRLDWPPYPHAVTMRQIKRLKNERG